MPGKLDFLHNYMFNFKQGQQQAVGDGTMTSNAGGHTAGVSQQPAGVGPEMTGSVGVGQPPVGVMPVANVPSIPTDALVPQHTSSPNMSPAQKQGTAAGPPMAGPPMAGPPMTVPPMPPKAGPPMGPGDGGSNPFRKDKARTSNYTSPGHMGGAQSNTSDKHPVLQINNPDAGLPSPIMSSSEETVTVSNPNTPPVVGKTKPESPIMPRKESPFQPPSRRRTLSGQSGGSIEEQPKLENQLSTEGDRKVDVLLETRDKSASVSSQSSKGSVKAEISKGSDRPVLDRERGSDRLGSDRERGSDRPVSDRERGSDRLGSDRERGSDRLGSDRERGSDRLGSDRERGSDRLGSDRERELSKYQERIKKASKPPPGSARGVMSPRRIESAFQQVQKQRAKHNMSPATSLWADNDLVLPSSNILLAPAAAPVLLGTSASTSNASSAKSSPAKNKKETRDVLSPVQMLISSLSEKQSKESTPERGVRKGDPLKSPGKTSGDMEQKRHNSRDARRDVSPRRDRHERGSSIDRELEISRQMEERDARREREDVRDGDYYRDDRHRGRDSRGPRDPRDYDPYYDRKYRGYYGDERYDRPRSRHSLGKIGSSIMLYMMYFKDIKA